MTAKPETLRNKIMLDNATPISQQDVQKRLKDCPGLLLNDERIDLGFKTIRDEYYFIRIYLNNKSN